ncbi:hypothetical protein E1B28_009000 [Marasmius oreades]|nr:uncharacterized protein E1B28_009000 [Marasmius oreades]KAG7092665.1 hypothetical protein E1B28_009000 [Marasmius oreades]
MVGTIKSEITSDGLVKSDVLNNSETRPKEDAFGEEKQVAHDDPQVSPDSPTVETVNGEVSGEIVPPLGHVHNHYGDPESDQDDDDDDDDDSDDSDPYALASRIRSLIQTLASRSRPIPDVDRSSAPQIPERILRDSLTGQPVPFVDAAFLSDTELIAKLKNAIIMNGMKITTGCGTGKGESVLTMTEGEKKSVWAVLDSFKAPPAHHWCADLPDRLARIGDAHGLDTLQTLSPTSVISDDSSVMMCFPLIPVHDSKVELAKSSVVSISPVGNGHSKLKKTLKKYRMYVTFGNKVDNGNVESSRSWKFWKKKGTLPRGASSALELNTIPPEDHPTLTSNSLPSLSLRPNVLPKADVKQRVWMPSTTNMSVQALWWGYRIFLPPPVLSILSDEEVEATKRVALITAALTWFFGNIPVTALPPPMQPAILMLQQLLPYLGYIGTFISWSWDSVRSFDTGNGVILSATWLLPVALIPGTWEPYDFPLKQEKPVQEQVSSQGDGTGLDQTLEFASRHPLPPSSGALASSASLVSSRSGSSILPPASSATGSIAPAAMPRLSTLAPISQPSSSASSFAVTTPRSKSQVSFASVVKSTPSSGFDSRTTSTLVGDQEASHPSLELSNVFSSASILSTATGSVMTSERSLLTTTDRTDKGSEQSVSVEISERPSQSKDSMSPSSSSLMMSPTTAHAAARASEVHNELEGYVEQDVLQRKSKEVEDNDLETNEKPEQDTGSEGNENAAEKVESVEKNISSARDIPANSHDRTNVEADGNVVQTATHAQLAPSTPAKVAANDSRVPETMSPKNGKVAEGGNVVQTSISVPTVKIEKENVSLSPVSEAIPVTPTYSKSKLAGSSNGNAGDAHSPSQIVTNGAIDKKEKRKSRGMAVMGGLWRLLTGSGN